jgi:ABC-2 type transport system permease protein
MYNLIAKEFRLQKKFFVFYLVLICLWLVAEYSFVAVIVMTGYMYVLNAYTLDSTANSNHGDKLMNSLPYTRQQIVLSKYVAPLIVTVITIIYTMIVQVLINKSIPGYSAELGTKKDIWIGIIIVLLLITVLLPIFYFFRNGYVLGIIAFVMLPILILWSKIDEWLKISASIYEISTQFSIEETIAYTSIFAVAISIASYMLTVKIYQRMDF